MARANLALVEEDAERGVACRLFEVLGIGEDQEVAPNNTREGREKNRRVQIRMLTNMGGGQNTAAQTAQPTGF